MQLNELQWNFEFKLLAVDSFNVLECETIYFLFSFLIIKLIKILCFILPFLSGCLTLISCYEKAPNQKPKTTFVLLDPKIQI